MGGALLRGIVSRQRVPAGNITASDIDETALAPLAELGMNTTPDPEAAIAGRHVILLAVKPQIAPSLGRPTFPFHHFGPVADLHHGRSNHGSHRGEAERRGRGRSLHASAARLCRRRSNGNLPRSTHRYRTAPAGQGTVRPGRNHRRRRRTSDGRGNRVGGKRPGIRVFNYRSPRRGRGFRRPPGDIATALAAQTVLGAAHTVLETGEKPADLRARVTSPNGTTVAGLQALRDKGLADALISAVQAATARSRELGR